MLSPSGFLLVLCLSNIQTQAVGIKVHFVAATLQDTGYVLCVLELSEIDVRAALLDGITNKFRRACLTLSAYNRGLFLLSRFVDDECSALGFLLSDLFGLDRRCKLGREGEVLE
jgi:hypothetical protein